MAALIESYSDMMACMLLKKMIFKCKKTECNLTVKDDYGNGELVDKILDKTRMKWTEKWTVQ